MTNNGIVNLKEFKIISKDNKIFKKSNFYCGWFIEINDDDVSGPINIDLEAIKNNKRIIDDVEYPEINKQKIINVNKDNLLKELPENIKSFLSNCM